VITPEEAQARILALGAPVAIENVTIGDAAGRWAARDIVAGRTQPNRDLSAMDGYAICYDDLPGPWRVIGESAAGQPFGGQVAQGEAVRIFTGAAVPYGADTVIIQEEVARHGDALTRTGEGPPHTGAHIRRAGSDFMRNDRLLAAGDALGPAALALAVIGGHGQVPVHRRIRVALLSTGNELVPPGADAGDDQLPNSNAPMLATLLRELPVDIVDLGIVRDDRAALAAAFARASACDILVTSGGASVGDHDLVRPVLIDLGATVDFWKVAMRPGKPLLAGKIDDTIILGLPGNPVSAFVTATLFLQPLVRHLSGARNSVPRRIAMTCTGQLAAVGPRTDFVRARWDGGGLAPLPSIDSGVLSSLARADALIIREAGSAPAAQGLSVEAILLG
jgi:molybdopterin molybdotransferase